MYGRRQSGKAAAIKGNLNMSLTVYSGQMLFNNIGNKLRSNGSLKAGYFFLIAKYTLMGTAIVRDKNRYYVMLHNYLYNLNMGGQRPPMLFRNNFQFY
ncbi:hypothetical protein SDC9_115256 [bioreactor metagenome]|uniref:Uncharacterized protein n=1 Tax=bioreactor metagenome TaxID=1076179 RepID=A0A645C2X3_9ZZZZ